MNQLINERNSLFKDIHSVVLKTAELMCKDLKDEDMLGFISKLKSDVVEKYCDLDETWKTSIQSVDSIAAKAYEDDEDIEKVYEVEMQKKARKNPKNNHLYRQIDEKVNAILHPEDEDLLETKSTINLIDPITKSRMTDPVKNVICNHTYDKNSIASLIKAKKSKDIRCPYQGCNNQVRFKLSDLIPDDLTRRALLAEEDDSS